MTESNGKGTDLVLPEKGKEFGRAGPFTGGTLIGIGGHLHPGGLTNDIDIVRPGGEDVTTVKRTKKCKRVKTRKRTKSGKRNFKKKCKIVRRKVTEHKDTTRIYTGEAEYWNPSDTSKGGVFAVHKTGFYVGPFSGLTFDPELAIQSHPLIVEAEGAPGIHRDDGRRAARTVVCVSEGELRFILIAAPRSIAG